MRTRSQDSCGVLEGFSDYSLVATRWWSSKCGLLQNGDAQCRGSTPWKWTWTPNLLTLCHRGRMLSLLQSWKDKDVPAVLVGTLTRTDFFASQLYFFAISLLCEIFLKLWTLINDINQRGKCVENWARLSGEYSTSYTPLCSFLRMSSCLI